MDSNQQRLPNSVTTDHLFYQVDVALRYFILGNVFYSLLFLSKKKAYLLKMLGRATLGRRDYIVIVLFGLRFA